MVIRWGEEDLERRFSRIGRMVTDLDFVAAGGLCFTTNFTEEAQRARRGIG